MTAGLGAGGDAIVAERARERNGGTADPRHAGTRYQFERTGYFVSDTTDSTPERPVFNRTVTLRDTWAKIASK